MGSKQEGTEGTENVIDSPLLPLLSPVQKTDCNNLCSLCVLLFIRPYRIAAIGPPSATPAALTVALAAVVTV
jgi:hypothetical protein